jgi:hypothetical protein
MVDKRWMLGIEFQNSSPHHDYPYPFGSHPYYLSDQKNHK